MLPDKSSAVLTGNDKIFGPFNVTGGIPYFGTLYYYVYVSNISSQNRIDCTLLQDMMIMIIISSSSSSSSSKRNLYF